MRMVHWCAIAAIALGSPVAAFAQQTGGAGGPGGRQEKLEESIPLNPNLIRELGRRVGDTRRAQEEVNTQYAAPQGTRVNVSFAPSETTPIVRVVKGYPTAISFFDSTGEPWPIEWNTNSNPAGGGGATCSESPAGGSGPAVAAVGFYVCTPMVGSNVLQISAASIEPRGGLVVNLKGAPKPVSFLLVSGGGVYDADMTVHVNKRGPNAVGLPRGLPRRTRRRRF